MHGTGHLSSQRFCPTLTTSICYCQQDGYSKQVRFCLSCWKCVTNMSTAARRWKKYTVTGNVPPPLRPLTSELPCFFVHCTLRFRCVVLEQDCFIPNYSHTTPYVQPCSASQPASYSTSTGVIPRDQSGRGMRLTGHSMSSEPNFQHFWTWPSRIFFKFGSSHVSPQIFKNLNFQIFMNCTFQVTVNWKQQKSSFFDSCAV